MLSDCPTTVPEDPGGATATLYICAHRLVGTAAIAPDSWPAFQLREPRTATDLEWRIEASTAPQVSPLAFVRRLLLAEWALFLLEPEVVSDCNKNGTGRSCADNSGWKSPSTFRRRRRDARRGASDA